MVVLIAVIVVMCPRGKITSSRGIKQRRLVVAASLYSGSISLPDRACGHRGGARADARARFSDGRPAELCAGGNQLLVELSSCIDAPTGNDLDHICGEATVPGPDTHPFDDSCRWPVNIARTEGVGG